MSATVDQNTISKFVTAAMTPQSAPAPTPAPAEETVVAPVEDDAESYIPGDLLEQKSAPTPDTPQPSAEDDVLKKAIESEAPPKDGKAWGALRAKLREYEKQLMERVEAETKAPLEQAKLIEELEAERKKNREKDEQLFQVDLIRSDKFKAEYVAPIQQSAQQAQRLLQQHGGMTAEDAMKTVDKAIRLPFADRVRMLDDVAPALQGTLSTILLQVDERIQRRDEAIANARATSAALEESKMHSQKVQSVKALDENLSKAVSELATAGNIFYKKSGENTPTGDAWNRDVELRVQTVKQTLLNNNQAEITRLVAEGYAAVELKKSLDRLQAKYDKVRAELKDVAAQRPSINGRDPGVQQKNELAGLTRDQIIAKAFERK